MRSREMTCEQVQAWLDAGLGAEAESTDQTFVSSHLTVCRDCQRALSALSALRAGLAGATWPTPDADARDEQIMAVLRREGICRTDAALEPRRPLVGLNLLARSLPALRPALATMAVSF